MRLLVGAPFEARLVHTTAHHVFGYRSRAPGSAPAISLPGQGIGINTKSTTFGSSFS